MSNVTAKQYTKQGNVIFHPMFDRPKVQNPIFRGKKKGCLSFMQARRTKESMEFRKAQRQQDTTQSLAAARFCRNTRA